jgi:hypothetical protein
MALMTTSEREQPSRAASWSMMSLSMSDTPNDLGRRLAAGSMRTLIGVVLLWCSPGAGV